jgi:uncharacterized membrane protein YfcA
MMPWYLDLALFLIAFVAGTVDTIAGGGGLITLPAILATGLPPQLALGTNKLQGTFGSGTAATRLCMKHRPPLRPIMLGVIFTACGAFLGAYLALHISEHYLSATMPPLLFLILLYSIFSKRMGQTKPHPPKVKPYYFFPVAGLLLGAYDGFLGPGVGAFWAISLVILLGFDLKKATIFTKVFNFTSNICSLAWFMVMGHVAYFIGICMALGQVCGGYLGAHLISSRGVHLIRPVFITMVSLLLLVLSYKTYNWRQW